MSLDEYILTYRGTTDNGEQGFVCNIPDYYDRYIKPLDKRFSEYNLYSNNTVICPLHDDTDPSLGLIKHRFLSGVQVYHCFGCGASGTVIRLHQFIQDIYYNRRLTSDDACKELADLFDIPLEDIDELADDDYDGKYMSMLKRLNSLKRAYTFDSFSRELLEIRKNTDISIEDRLRLLNIESIKMISTQKKLYS